MAVDVSILISAIDQASTTLRNIKQRVKDIDDSGTGVNNVANKLGLIGEKAKAAGQQLTTFATVPLVAAGAGLVKLASDAQETQSKFDTVFKDSILIEIYPNYEKFIVKII